MRKIRFTIGGLMAVVLVLAIGLAALRNANETWAGLVLLLTHGLLGLAILGVILCKGAERAWWLGFAVFEWGYLILASTSWGSLSREGLPTLSLLTFLRLKLGLGMPPLPDSERAPCSTLERWRSQRSPIPSVRCWPQSSEACWRGQFSHQRPFVVRPDPDARATDRTRRKPWLRPAVFVLAGLVLFGTVVAIWSTPDAILCAGGMYLLTCVLLGIAVLGGLFGRGKRREVCMGAALFGVGYLYMALVHTRSSYFERPRPHLITDQYLYALRPRVPSRAWGTAANVRILQALEQPISMRFFEETPLGDVLKYIQMATSTPDYPGIPIYVNPIGLQEAERTLQSTVSIDLQGVPLKTTLRLCLKQLGLMYWVEDGCLQITSEDSGDTRPESDDPFLIVGHCLMALIAAAVGGVLAPLVAALSRGRPGRTEADDAPVPGRIYRPEDSLEAGSEGGSHHA